MHGRGFTNFQIIALIFFVNLAGFVKNNQLGGFASKLGRVGYLAFSTILLNVSGLSLAIIDKIFLSNSMFFFLSIPMNLL